MRMPPCKNLLKDICFDTLDFIGHSTQNNCKRLFSSAIVLAIEPTTSLQ